MKKIIIICCLILLASCANEENNISIPTSRVYDRYASEPSNMYYTYLITNRIKGIQEGEIEEIIILDEKGNEKTITDSDELMKFSQFISNMELSEENVEFKGKAKALSIKIKNYDPILLNQRGNLFCISIEECLKITGDDKISDLLDEMKGEIRHTLPLDWDDVSVQLHSDFDNKDEPVYEYRESNIISNYERTDEVKKTLLLSKYIDEDFNHFSEIKNIDSLVAGLMNSSYSYSQSYNYDYNVDYIGVNGDKINFKNEVPFNGSAIPLSYKVILEKSLIDEGKKRFGDDFSLHQIKNGTLLSDEMYVSRYHQQKHYYSVNLPYEHYFRTEENVYIKEKNEANTKFEIVRYISYIVFEGNEPKEVIIDNVGNYYMIDDVGYYSENIENTIKEHITNFDVWEYVLKDEKLVSGKKIKSATKNKVNQKIGVDKADTFYDDGKFVINYKTAGALLVSNQLLNQEYETIRINSNEHYNTILVQNKTNKIYSSYLFDNQWNKIDDKTFMKENEIDIEKLNLTLENLSSACKDRTCIFDLEKNRSRVDLFKSTNKFLITSQNKIGYILNDRSTLVIFEEGEIQ